MVVLDDFLYTILIFKQNLFFKDNIFQVGILFFFMLRKLFRVDASV